MEYVYPAKVSAEAGGYVAEFPDAEGAVTQGETLFEVLANAEDALGEILIAYENNKVNRTEPMTNKIAEPSPLANFTDTGEVFYTLIRVDTDAQRLKNGAGRHECWYSPQTKKYFTMSKSDDEEVRPTVEKILRKVSGVAA